MDALRRIHTTVHHPNQSGWWICMLLLLLPLSGSATEGEDTTRVLDPVDVLAPRTFSRVIPSQSLSGGEIERLRSRSVADALRYFSGVQIKDYGGVGGIKTVDMRSMGSNHMGVFYDGIQLGNAQNGQIDLGRFSLENLEAIDMYNGQKSDIFQSAKDYGSAGTLYLQSRTPRFSEDERGWRLRATLRGGSFGLVNPAVTADFRVSSRVTMTASAEYTYATGRYRFRYRRLYADGSTAWDTTATRRNGDISALRAEVGAYGTLHRGYWQARGYFYQSERGIPGAIVNNVWKTAQRQWDRNVFLQGRFRKSFTPRYALQVNGKLAYDYMRYLNPDTTLMLVNNRYYQREVYVSVANRVRILKGWEANLAADWQWNTLDGSQQGFSKPRRHTLMTALATAIDYHGLRAQGSLLWTLVNDRTVHPQSMTMPVSRNRYSRLTPALFLSYEPVSGLTIRGFAKKVFRMPTFNDLYYTDIGNATLRPETALQYDLGASWHKGFATRWVESLTLGADAYYNRVSDKIIAVPNGSGQYRWMMMNIGLVRILGADFSGEVTAMPLPSWMVKLRLNYTYQRARDYTDPEDVRPDGSGTYRGQIAYIPEHSGSVAATVRWRQLELAYSFIYVGERYHTSSNIPENYEPSWYTHDLSASYSLPAGRTMLRAAIEVNNLLNQQYEVIQNYPMPGRNFRASLTVTI